MKDFKGPRKGGFGGNKGGSHGGFGGRGGDRGFGGRGGRNEFERPEMHRAICSECGDKCEVPFRPNGTKPVLCSACFGAQKGGNDNRSFGGRERMFDSAPVRTMFKATCQDCGAICEVPFKPTSGKPVYCSDCFRGSEQGGKTVKHAERKEERRHDGLDLSALNSKLDQIIALLQTNSSPVEKFVMSVAKEEIVEPVKKAKAKKVTEKKTKVAVKAKKAKAVKK